MRDEKFSFSSQGSWTTSAQYHSYFFPDGPTGQTGQTDHPEYLERPNVLIGSSSENQANTFGMLYLEMNEWVRYYSDNGDPLLPIYLLYLLNNASVNRQASTPLQPAQKTNGIGKICIPISIDIQDLQRTVPLSCQHFENGNELTE